MSRQEATPGPTGRAVSTTGPPLVVATAAGLVRIRDGQVSRPDPDQPVRAMATAGDRWWLADDDNRILTGGSGGPPAGLGRLDGPGITALAPGPEGLLIGTEGAHLYRLGDAGPRRVEGFEATAGRDSWYTPWGGPPAVRSLAVDGAVIYANVHVGGIARSRDGGATWEPTVDIDLDIHEVRTAGDDGRVLAAAGAGGLVVSDDGAETWHRHSRGLHATYCRAVAATAGHVLVSASSGPGGGRAAVYRMSPDGGSGLERVGPSSDLRGNVDTGWLDGAGVWAGVVTAAGEVYLSGDEGAGWERVAGGLSTPVALRFLTGA